MERCQVVEPTDSLFWGRTRWSERGCLVWTGAITSTGYGNVGRRGTQMLPHRYAYYLTFGSWPEVVLHVCDNRLCCNPLHLMAGTNDDNMADMRLKGRAARGERSVKAKLTETDVLALRAAHAEGVDCAELGRRFGVSNQQAWHIVTRKQWRHV